MIGSALFLASACGGASAGTAGDQIASTSRARAEPARSEEIVGAGALFAEHGVRGAFVVRRASGGADRTLGGVRVDERFVPASTFKIPNTLIGLETGVIPDASFALPWDGTEREIAAWNADHDLRSAIRESVVWWYQEVARRIGLPRMREHVARLDFGNTEIGEQVDTFWLEGPLAISPREQVDFLQRMTRGELPVAERSASILRDVIASETHGDATVRWKTGTYPDERGSHTWLVGWVERDGETSAWFALLLLGAREELGSLQAARIPLATALLRSEGLLPE